MNSSSVLSSFSVDRSSSPVAFPRLSLLLLLGVALLALAARGQVCNSIIEAALNQTPLYSPATLRTEYLQGKRHLFVVAGSLQFVAGVEARILIDLDDYASSPTNQITEEGLQDWVTVWVVLKPCLGCLPLLPGRIGLLTYNRVPGICSPATPAACDDPDFITLTVGNLQASFGAEIVSFTALQIGTIQGMQFQGIGASLSAISGELQILKVEMKRADLNCAFAQALAFLAGPVEVGVAPALLLDYVLGDRGLVWRVLAGEQTVVLDATEDNGFHPDPTGTDVFLSSVNSHGTTSRTIGEIIPIDVTYFNHGSQPVTATVAVFIDNQSGSQLFDRRMLVIPANGSASYTIAWNTTLAQTGRNVFRFEVEDTSPPEPVGNTGNNTSKVGFFLSQSLLPSAAIVSITPSTVASGSTLITFTGAGSDPDEPTNAAAITGYSWTSDLGMTNGQAQLYPTSGSGFGSSSNFTLRADQLKIGTHRIKLRVRDNDNQLSGYAEATLVITDGSPPPAGVFVAAGTVESPILVGGSARYSVVYRNVTNTPPDQSRVIINGTSFTLLPGLGSYAAGKTYYFDRTFNTAGSANTYHFEFVVGGTTHRFPQAGELDGPAVTSPGNLLTNGIVTPATGDLSSVFTYEVTFRNPAGRGPTYGSVALFVDGSAQGINMSRVIPNDENWTAGVRYRATVSGLALGAHSYHFSCAVGGTTHNVRFPESGEAPGPTVVAAIGLTVTVTPSGVYGPGSRPEFDIEVRDETGQLVNVDYGRFYLDGELSFATYVPVQCSPSSEACQQTGIGRYHLTHRANPVGVGYYNYVMYAEKSGYPPATGSYELLAGVQPDEPVRITNVVVSPPTFKPGVRDVTLGYSLTHTSFVSVLVRSAAGVVIRTIAGPNVQRPTGFNTEVWNGTDSNGVLVSPGDYQFEIWARKDLGDNPLLYAPIEFATEGNNPGQARDTTDVLYDPTHDEVLVASHYLSDANTRVLRYSSSGTWRANLPSCTGQFRRFSVAQDGDGFFYVQDELGNLFKYDRSSYSCLGTVGNVGVYYESRTALATDGGKLLYGVDNSSRAVARIDLATGTETGTAYPHPNSIATGVAVDGDKNVWVVYNAEGVIRNVLYKYDRDLNDTGQRVDLPFSAGDIDLDVKHGYLLYLHRPDTVKVYDIQAGAFVAEASVNGSLYMGVEAVENGFTFVLQENTGNYMVARYRDRMSAARRLTFVRASLDIPIAEISSPTNGATIFMDAGSLVTVSGTASATNLDHYSLEAGSGATPAVWSLITNAASVVSNGVLGQWNLEGASVGTNILRLRVFDSLGSVGEALASVNVIAANLPPQTYALGPDGGTITNDTASIYLSGTDDSTPPESLEYSWNLNDQGWSAYSTNPIVDIIGLGSGTNTLRARARDNEGFADPTPAIVTLVGTVSHIPDTPANLYPFDGQTSLPLTTTLIASTFSDGDPASLFSRAEFQVRSDAGNFSAPQWDSGELNPATSIVQIPAGVLDETAKYWWRARYRDDSGLWSAWSAETSLTTLPPSLTATLQGSNIVLSWTTNAVGYGLQSATNLGSTNWNSVSPPPVPVNGRNVITNRANKAAEFYRLNKQSP